MNGSCTGDAVGLVERGRGKECRSGPPGDLRTVYSKKRRGMVAEQKGGRLSTSSTLRDGDGESSRFEWGTGASYKDVDHLVIFNLGRRSKKSSFAPLDVEYSPSHEPLFFVRRKEDSAPLRLSFRALPRLLFRPCSMGPCRLISSSSIFPPSCVSDQ